VAAGAVKVWRCPTIGEQFAVLSQGGELCNAIPIVTLFSDNNPRPSIDPDEILIQLPDDNFISINTSSNAAVFKLKMVTFDVEQTIFTGTVHANDVISSDKDVTAGSISLKNHKTTGVRSGNEVAGVPQ
jgi:phage baseplate assembly protein gpV